MNEMSDVLKEISALSAMQIMLEEYSSKNGISFEEAINKFSNSKTYEVLFDFETELWKEGPDYLLEWFERELRGKAS